MSSRLTSQGCSWLDNVALRASAALRCPPPAWWKTMVSLRKISLASFSPNEFLHRPCPREPMSGSHTLVFPIFEQARFVSDFSSLGISQVSFFAGMRIVGPLSVLVDLDSILTNRDVGRLRVNPGSAIEVVDAMRAVVLVQSRMGVAAEDSNRMLVTGMRQGTLGNLLRQTLPARAQPVEKTGQGFVLRIPLLQLQ